MKRYWWLLVVPALLLVWWIVSRGQTTPQVHFSAVRHAYLASTVTTNGKVEPAEWSAVSAETSGVVRTVLVSRGQQVRRGQTLITLDTNSAQADLAAALAREQESEADVNTLGQGGKAANVADLEDRIAAAQTAVQVAQRIYDSDKRLEQQQAATKLQLDTDADALTRTKLNLEALRNQRETAVTSSDVTVAKARVRDARQAVVFAQHRISLGNIVAPMDGTIYDFDIKVGAFLEPGTLVGRIGNLNQVKVLVYVDEPDLGRVGLGMPVTITSDSYPGQSWKGRVDKLPTQITSLDNRKVGEVSTTVENPNHALLPGISVYVTVTSKVVENALVIPKAALRRIGNSDGAYKLSGSTLVWTPIQAGISDINNVQVLSGLSEGDRVADRVIQPSDAEIRNGMRVRPSFN